MRANPLPGARLRRWVPLRRLGPQPGPRRPHPRVTALATPWGAPDQARDAGEGTEGIGLERFKSFVLSRFDPDVRACVPEQPLSRWRETA